MSSWVGKFFFWLDFFKQTFGSKSHPGGVGHTWHGLGWVLGIVGELVCPIIAFL